MTGTHMSGAGSARVPLAAAVEEAVSTLRSNPELAVGVALGLVVVVVLFWLAIRRLRRTNGESFLRVLRNVR